MVNAKNAFMGTLIAGLIIAAVGSEKYFSGNWDSMSGDFVYEHKEGKFSTMTGRYYAENTNGCTISETGATAKGKECEMHKGVEYQIEMTNGELEWFASNDVVVSTNLQTGESATTQAKEEPSQDDGEHDEWTVGADGKLTTKDGTTMEVTNAQSPGQKIRDLWGGFKCGFGTKCWAEYLWKKYTSCAGLFWALLDSLIWCIAWIIYCFIAGLITTWTGGAGGGTALAGLYGFYVWCIRGTLVVLVLLLLRCTIDVLMALYDAATGALDKLLADNCRQLRGGNPGGGGMGGGGPNGNGRGGHPTGAGGSNDTICQENCRVLSGWGGNGSSGNGGDDNDGCRMLKRDDGGDAGGGGSGGGGSGNCGC